VEIRQYANGMAMGMKTIATKEMMNILKEFENYNKIKM